MSPHHRSGRVRGTSAVWTAIQLGVLAGLAYVPALASSPGRMPADTKYFLYSNPSALLADARFSYDPQQFGGWVTHQVVGYLWPTGPWYWLFDRIGVADWVAHRLWIGSLLFLAGAGMWWLARDLGLRGPALLVAAVAYQCSPYLLPYVSRTSVMLLPWVGLPWLIGLTRRALHRGGWRDAALCALIVVTVGGVNTTATLLIAPGPVLWLLHEGYGGRFPWRSVAATAGRIALWTAPACAWWIASVSVQGRYGGDVLTYSEGFEAVASTASAGEVLRGHGYWLSYLTEPVENISLVRPYEHVPGLVAVGFLLLLASVAGLAFVRWPPRRFAVWMVFSGVVIATAAHVVGSRTVVAALLAQNTDNVVVLGMRSATRAGPLVALGLALGLAALCQAATPRVRRGSLLGALAVVVVVANLPALWTFGLVDPVNDRADPIPAPWREVGSLLDERPRDRRVLQIPGTEFGSHTWGVTVDPPLAGHTRQPLLTRDILPLGSDGLMDTLFTFDDTIQNGVFEPASIVPVAHLLGVDSVVVPLDLTRAYDTYSSAALAAALDTVPGITRSRTWDGSLILYDVDDPRPVIHATAGEVLFVGDGEGLVDAAAAGVLGPDLTLVRAGALTPDELESAAANADAVVITDSNRKRLRQFGTSQDTTGMTEDLQPATTVDRDWVRRLYAYPDLADDQRTLARQEGDVRAVASAYGGEFELRPEDRAFHAVDGDPDTAWLVGHDWNPVGEHLRLEYPQPRPLNSLTLVSPRGERNRRIRQVEVRSANGTSTHDLGDLAPGEAITLPIDLGVGSWLEVHIRSVEPERLEEGVVGDGVGFAEVNVAGETATEVVVLPPLPDALADLDPSTPVFIVLSRERADRPERTRTDPETRLVRDFSVPGDRQMTLRLTARAPAPLDTGCRDDILTLDGSAIPVRVFGTPDTDGQVPAEPCGAPHLALGEGPHRLETAVTDGFTIDRVVFASGEPAPGPTPPAITVLQNDRTRRRVAIGPCAQDCWFVVGEGTNDGWHAELDGEALGDPMSVDGGVMGWRLPPSAATRIVELQWRPQRVTDIGIAVTAMTAVAGLGVVVVSLIRRRMLAVAVETGPSLGVAPVSVGARRHTLVAVAATLVALAFIGPLYAPLVAFAVWVAIRTRRAEVLGAVSCVIVALTAGGYLARIVLHSPEPGFGWVSAFEWAHRPSLTAALLLAAAVTLVEDDAGATPSAGESSASG